MIFIKSGDLSFTLVILIQSIFVWYSIYMDTLAKADIFFFVTTIAVILLTTGFIVVLVYLIKILRDLRGLVSEMHDKADEVMEDIEEFTAEMRRRQVSASIFTRLIQAFVKALFFQDKKRKK